MDNLTKEQQAEIRRKQIATLKAQNQMLEDAKKSVQKTNKLDDTDKALRINQIDTAIKENIMKAQNGLNATSDELDKVKFTEVNPFYREKYEERLKVRGLTDEELHNKGGIVTASASSNGKTKNRKHVSRREKEEFKQDIELETKLMNQTYISNDKSVESVKPKNEVPKKVKITRDVKEEEEDVLPSSEKKMDISADYDFDFSSIPDYIQYDVIPLPSKGQCYPHKIGRIPVAYLTASDENLIASPNMYRDGKVLDVILDRKILDKRIKASELCNGDRDAIIVWLRATGYGSRFPITATNPDNGKRYNVDFDLSTLNYMPFDLKGDENGYFDYKTENGAEIKFKILTHDEDEALKKSIINERLTINAFDAVSHLNALQGCMNNLTNLNDDDAQSVKDCIDDLKDIIGENVDMDEANQKEYEEIITKQMAQYTVSINGNYDRDYIENFINNMRAKDAYDYRTYVLNHKPGVDFNITINIPESDGGGSFATFLTIDDTVFLNI